MNNRTPRGGTVGGKVLPAQFKILIPAHRAALLDIELAQSVILGGYLENLRMNRKKPHFQKVKIETTMKSKRLIHQQGVKKDVRKSIHR